MMAHKTTWRMQLLVAVVFISCMAVFVREYLTSERMRTLRREVWAVHSVAKSLSITTQDGSAYYLPAQHGVVMCDGHAVTCSLTKSDFVWSFREDSDEPTVLKTAANDRWHFFACSGRTTPNGERVFVGPAPLYGVIVNENEVDWTTHEIPRSVIEDSGRI